MASSESAPATYKQPSRKGKKAWRKNVDVTQITSGLEEVREQIVQGGVIAEKTSAELFAVDTTGSTAIQKQVAKRHPKPLKVDEILAQRSAVPAVSTRKRLSDFETASKSKKRKVSRKELDKLRAIAYGGDQVKKDVVQTGDAPDHDPWAVQEEKKDPKFSFLEEKKPKKEPVTLKHAPISLAKNGKALPAVRKPEAGKSYNPLLEDWANLIEREGAKEVEAEKKRLAEAREEAERIERALKAAEEEEKEDDDAESAWESEWEGFSEDDGTVKKKRPERKTQAQRNKIKRRKEAERKALHEAKMKEKERQAERIKELAKSVEEKEKARAAAAQVALIAKEDLSSDEAEEVLRRKGFGKAPIPEAPLEVVLADELQDSLRRLKPEGNLLKDRFRSMIIRGKVESRKQISHAKKPKVKVTEKWSYKDWSLDKVK
ncbi:p60 domain-containing protein [Westerdykella ornata]|uniref:Ribosome biogenesis protein NOP53 n=1 Tax=Westerdykella ornata TaxID=318751 RepID=A0A6A6JAF2_WESOR|nr:p60 domain-containing protein [Westerdykella ornata]KAF2273580.1 p60 domain-containing protein [Westerdykella ornata]